MFSVKIYIAHGPPQHIRSDFGPAFIAQAVWDWLCKLDVMTLCTEPGSPWAHGYWETVNGILKDERLNDERFCTLKGAQVLNEQ